jgi:hypothetical protein
VINKRGNKVEFRGDGINVIITKPVLTTTKNTINTRKGLKYDFRVVPGSQ